MLSEFARTAHRLRTVIAFDKILGNECKCTLSDFADGFCDAVLEAGRVAEFDSPSKLIEDQTSRFHALCKAVSGRDRRKRSGN